MGRVLCGTPPRRKNAIFRAGGTMPAGSSAPEEIFSGRRPADAWARSCMDRVCWFVDQ